SVLSNRRRYGTTPRQAISVPDKFSSSEALRNLRKCVWCLTLLPHFADDLTRQFFWILISADHNASSVRSYSWRLLLNQIRIQVARMPALGPLWRRQSDAERANFTICAAGWRGMTSKIGYRPKPN